MKMVLRAAFDRYSGYGNDAVDMAVNFERLGVKTTPWPIGLLPGLPREFCDLLEREPGDKHDVLLQFSDPAQIKPWDDLVGLAPKMFGYTMWERTPFQRRDFVDWGRKARSWSKHGMAGLAVTCDMNVEAFRAVDKDIPMTVVPCGIEPDDWPARLRENTGKIRFLIAGVLAGRKEPFRLLDAWREFRQRYPQIPAELVVHTFSPGVHSKVVEIYGPDIVFSAKPLTRVEMVDLYHACDVLVSVSRGEGNNKPAMEFMATGGTVMATDWSGHQNWLNEHTYALSGKMGPSIGVPGCEDFIVDHDAIVTGLAELAEAAHVTRAAGMECASWIRQRLTWQHVLPPFVEWMERTG